MDWSVLGIDPTIDKKAITMAYRKQLAHTNPEDKPEEFKILREAYEKALELAKEAKEAAKAAEVDAASAGDGDEYALGSPVARNLSPLELWSARLEALYADYQRRIDLEAWRALLADDVCIAIDSRGKAEEALFRFLSQERFLNQEVWQLFDARFSWRERRQELYETLPRGFVDNVVIESIMYQSLINYNLFTPGQDAAVCDEYVRQFIRAINAPIENAEPTALELLGFPEQNPYGTAFLAFVQATNGDETALSTLREIWGSYPDELYIAQRFIEALLDFERFEEAETVARQTRKRDGSNRHTTWLLASALASQKQYKEAIECINDLMRTTGGDQHDLYTLSDIRMEWNLSLIDKYEAILAEDPDNNDTILDLAWCYLQNDILDKSREWADRLDRTKTTDYDYYNLVSQLSLAEADFEAGNTDSRKLADLIYAMEPDGTEKTAKRIGRLPSVIARCGYCLYCLKRRDESVAAYEESLAISPRDLDVLNEYARVLVAFGERSAALDLVERIIDINPTAYFGYFMMAQLYFDERNDRDAFMAVNRALDLEGGDLGVYILKLRILIRNGAREEAAAILDYLQTNGCGEDLGVVWCMGLLAELDADMEGADQMDCWLRARAIYQVVTDRIETGEEFGFAPALYFRIAAIEGQINTVQTPELRKHQLALVEKGLEADPEDRECLDYRAWLLVRLDRTSEAIAAYEKIVAKPHAGLDAEFALAELYRNDIKRYSGKALPLYRKLAKAEPNNVFFLYYAALCALRFKELDEAERYLLRERDLEPNCADPYRLLFFVYLAMGRNEEALRQINDCIVVAERNREGALGLYRMKTRVQRRMGLWDDAIATVVEGYHRYLDPDRYRTIFEILLQAGRYDEARNHLLTWSKAIDLEGRPFDRSGLVRPRLLMELFQNGFEAAKAYGTKGKSYLRAKDRRDFMMLVNYLNDDLDACVDLLSDEPTLADLDNETEFLDKTAPIAAYCWIMGEEKRAKEHAQLTLMLCNRLLAQYTTYEALWHTKRALALGILGQEESARADLATARALPLCEQCPYGSCKDADFYEAFLEEILGNSERALELAREGKAAWPDESDFWFLEKHLNRKGTDDEGGEAHA